MRVCWHHDGMSSQPFVVVTLTGPSGTGKTNLCDLLRERNPSFRTITSTTTRMPRANEADGRDYHFVSKERFAEMLRNGDLVEHVDFAGHAYGLNANDVTAALHDDPQAVGLVVVEPHGAAQVKDFCARHGWVHVSIFIDNDMEILMRRWLERFERDLANPSMDHDRVRAAFAHRLATLATQERDEWIRPARMPGAYDLVLDRYTEANRDVVVDQVRVVVSARRMVAQQQAAQAATAPRRSV